MADGPDPGQPKYAVDATNARGVVIGENNTQHVIFIENYIQQRNAGMSSESFLDIFAEEWDLHTRDCIGHCPSLEDGKTLLSGRAADLKLITDIALSGTGFCLVEAPMSAGKTAAAAWLTLAPPEKTVALACFVGPATSGDQFLDILIRRLSSLVHYDFSAFVNSPEKHLLLGKLLEQAGRQRREAGGELIVVVDGLDEDPRSPGVVPVAQLLPRELPAHVHLIVFSRPASELLPAGHPLLAESARFELAPAPEARVEIERAQSDLDVVMAESPSIAASVLTMLAVAGPLTETDLVDLLKPDMDGKIGLAFRDPLRRLTYAVGAGADKSYRFGLIALRQVWADELGSGAMIATRQIDDWADRYAGQGWPATTPPYCLDGYVDMLVRRGESDRLARLALDEHRRSRLLAATGSRVAEATAIDKAQRLVSTAAEPDLGLATRLALESWTVRISLAEAAQPEMVGFDVRRGEVRKAVDTVMSLSPKSGGRRHSAQAELVAALYLTDRDDTADALLRRLRSEYPAEQLAGSVARLVAAQQPDRAIGLAAGDGAALAAIAPALAAHDDHAELAIRSVWGHPELQLAVARALAPRQPQAALRAIKSFDPYREWSAGSKLLRGSSFARVEVARSMTSIDAALEVLSAEREGSDGKAALVAMGMLLSGQEGGGEFAQSLGDIPRPARLLARFALGEETGRLTEQSVEADWPWVYSDLDLLQRFDPVLVTSPAIVRADYARLLRSVRIMSVESPRAAAEAVASQLLLIDDLHDEDAANLARRFAGATIRRDEVNGAVARRIVLAEPRRAVALARDSGPASTQVLADVLQDLTAGDPELVVEFIDAIDPRLSGTRSVAVGVVGRLVDPENTRLIEELSRRILPPESSAAVTAVRTDVALRVAALLPESDDRARRLHERFSAGAGPFMAEVAQIERAISLATAGDPEAAMRLMAAADGAPGPDSRTRQGWSLLARYLPDALARDVLSRQVLPHAHGRVLHWAMCKLAALDPMAAIEQLPEGPCAPHTYATVLRMAAEAAEDSSARDQIRAKVAHLIAVTAFDEALLLWWASSLTSFSLPSTVTYFPAGHERIISCLARDDGQAIIDACDNFGLEPLQFLGAWVYAQPTRLARSVNAVIDRFDKDETSYRVKKLVDEAAQADIVTANAAIDDIDWHSGTSYHPQLLRDESHEILCEELTHSNREAAYRRAEAIEDAEVATRALATLAAAIAASPVGQPGPALADVLATAHSRGHSTIAFAQDIVSELSWIGRIEPSALAVLLAETSSWPTDHSTWLLYGRLFSLLRHDSAAVATVADAIITAGLPNPKVVPPIRPARLAPKPWRGRRRTGPFGPIQTGGGRGRHLGADLSRRGWRCPPG